MLVSEEHTLSAHGNSSDITASKILKICFLILTTLQQYCYNVVTMFK